jgi:hypothetical protein
MLELAPPRHGGVGPVEGEQSAQALRLIATVLGHDPTPAATDSLSLRERVVLMIACDALGLDDPVL